MGREILEKVSSRQTKLATQRLEGRLKAATKEQLVNTIFALSGNLLQTAAIIPDDDTKIYLEAELVCALLDEGNRVEVVCLLPW